jgi:hypothetical protein
MLVLLGAAAAGYLLFRDTRTPLEIEYAAINRRDLADPVKNEDLAVIGLVPSNFRDTAATAGYSASELTRTVVFRLALPVSEPEGAELEASIERSGNRLFTVPARVFRSAFGSELRFMAPREVLTPGQYEIVVRSVGPKDTEAVYQLRIE